MIVVEVEVVVVVSVEVVEVVVVVLFLCIERISYDRSQWYVDNLLLTFFICLFSLSIYLSIFIYLSLILYIYFSTMICCIVQWQLQTIEVAFEIRFLWERCWERRDWIDCCMLRAIGWWCDRSIQHIQYQAAMDTEGIWDGWCVHRLG